MTRFRLLLVALAAAAMVFGAAPSASADPGDLGTTAPPPTQARVSIIDIVNDFIYCDDAWNAALDQLYPPTDDHSVFNCMRDGLPG
jgi:hypothetical protein